MSNTKKQVRANFRNSVFHRDGYRCLTCGFQSTPDKAVEDLDAHHIVDRTEMPGGGYVAENGISLCKATCHYKAEATHRGETPEPGFSIDELYEKIGSSYEKAHAASLTL